MISFVSNIWVSIADFIIYFLFKIFCRIYAYTYNWMYTADKQKIEMSEPMGVGDLTGDRVVDFVEMISSEDKEGPVVQLICIDGAKGHLMQEVGFGGLEVVWIGTIVNPGEKDHWLIYLTSSAIFRIVASDLCSGELQKVRYTIIYAVL